MMNKIVLYVVLVFCSVNLLAQEEKKSYPFSFETSYIGDAYANANGGIKNGGGFMGMANIRIGFETEKAGWWRGGSFFINGASIHGKSLSENYIGDLQVVSNIDAGNHTYMHELWFSQHWGNFEFKIGLQDMNVDFVASENASEYINSSFGVPPVISAGIPAPIFPLTGLGFSAQWAINDIFVWQAVIFDGCQTPFDRNPYNLHWRMNPNDGLLMVNEFQANVKIKELKGSYKLGNYYHTGLKEYNEETHVYDEIFQKNYGLYIIADQTVMNDESQKKKINLFTQLAISPKKTNNHNYYIGLGANYYGVFSNKGKDVLGLAIAHAGLHSVAHKHETTFELFYKYQLSDNFTIQPDIQYIMNPSGTGEKLNNALVGLLRFHLNF